MTSPTEAPRTTAALTAHTRWHGEKVCPLTLGVDCAVVSALVAIEAEAAAPPVDGLPCPTGCGCRIGTEDADRADCGCDGPCCWDSWDDFMADVLNRPDYYDELRTARGLSSSVAATSAAKPEAGAGLDERAFLLDCAGHLAKYGCNVYHKNGPCRWQWNWQREAASPRSDAGSES